MRITIPVTIDINFHLDTDYRNATESDIDRGQVEAALREEILGMFHDGRSYNLICAISDATGFLVESVTAESDY